MHLNIRLGMIITALCLLTAIQSNAQVQQEWVERYNHTFDGDDTPYAIAIDNTGNSYITGSIKVSVSNIDYYTIKYNPIGTVLWAVQYGGSANGIDVAYDIAVDSSGNVYITGEAIASGSNNDYVTIKYDASGNQLWVATYDGPGNSGDTPREIYVDISGNVYVTGWSNNGSNLDYATVKYDANGNQLWVARYNSPSNQGDAGYALAVDNSGNVYVTGESGGIGQYATVKYDTNGNELWVETYNGGNSDIAKDIVVDNSGNVYITGQSYSPSNGADYVTIKYDTNGNQQWLARYNGTANANEDPEAIALDNQGNVYVTGYSTATNRDYLTVKYDASGNQLWEQRYDGTDQNTDQAFALKIDTFGNVYVTGRSTESSDYNSVTIKYDTNGNQIWLQSYGAPTTGGLGDTGVDIEVDALGNVYVGGPSPGTNGNKDYFLVKYSDILSTQLVFTTQPAGSISGDPLSTQPVIQAQNGSGSLDTDFNDIVTLTTSAPGSLSGNSATAVSGIVTFTNLIYTATANNESFTLTADDQSGGTEGDLPSVNANPLQSIIPQFTDVAASVGITYPANAGGVAWGDYDNDGDLDIYFPRHLGVNRLYRNDNGLFTNVAASMGVDESGSSLGAAWGDYDNDGDIDLYVTNSSPNRLYRNDGTIFSEIGGISGVDDSSGQGHTAPWGDYDNDGDLDIYLTNNTLPNRLYRNDNGLFIDVAPTFGINDNGASNSSTWGDYDNDGDIDIYLSKNHTSNRLFRNNGTSFDDVANSVGVDDSATAYGATWGDYDNDGDLDLYLPNAGSANRLYQNNGNLFSEIGNSAGVDDSGGGHGAAWGDYDNDGDLDLFTTNYLPSQGNRLYQNNNNTFSNVASNAGVDNIGGGGRSVSWGDYDNDGDIDAYVITTSGNTKLFRNNGTSNNFLSLKLEGTKSNRSGIGAVVTATTGVMRQRRDVDGGSAFLTQPSLPVEFGFGTMTTIDSLIIQWPSGIISDTTNITTNQFLTLTEPLITPTLSLPDTTAQYATTLDIPIRITDTSGLGIVASEISVTYRKDIVLSATTALTSLANTITTNSLVYQGWSVEENILPGAAIDTLSIAMSTAQDTLTGSGDLVYITLQLADKRMPDSTTLDFVNVLFNDGTPLALTASGKIKLTGNTGIVTATPDTIIPRNTINISVLDIDANKLSGSIESLPGGPVLAFSKAYGDSENVFMTETGLSTGIFNGTIPTEFQTSASFAFDNNGKISTIAGDTIVVTYRDSLDATGMTSTFYDTINVIGGEDGAIQSSYVIQSLNGRNSIRDTVRIQVTDTDLDLDSGIVNQVSATVTNTPSGEIENVTLVETGNNTGIFHLRVPTVLGISGTNNDGVITVAPWDTLHISYPDSLTAQGGTLLRTDVTRVINLFGDVASNDNIQAFDAARLLAMVVGLTTPTHIDSLVGDVDGNNELQAFDASLMLQYVVRLVDRFPVQTDTTLMLPTDPKNHPFLKPAPAQHILAFGDLHSQTDGTYLLPITLSERKEILSGSLTLSLPLDIDVIDVISQNNSFMTAHHIAQSDLKIAFAGSQSEQTGPGNLITLKLRAQDPSLIQLSLDHIVLNGQTHTPSLRVQTLDTKISAPTPLITHLYANVPNPFNPQTTLRYDIAEAGEATLVIYNINGQQILTLISEHHSPGSYQITWDGKDTSGHASGSGLYFLRMTTPTSSQVRKLLLLK